MPTESELCHRSDLVTDKLSTQIRTLALGLVAFAGSLLLTSISGQTGKSPTTAAAALLPKWVYSRLLLVGTLGLMVLLLDILQYIFQFVNVRVTLTRVENEQKQLRKEGVSEEAIEHVEKKYQPALRVITEVAFWSKIVVLVGTTIWLTIIVFAFFQSA